MRALLYGILLPGATGFHLPYSFSEGEAVDLDVDKMASPTTLLPLEYYRLPFCQPDGGPQIADYLVDGWRIHSSPYRLNMKKDMYCEQVCVADLGKREQRGVMPNKVLRAIRKKYRNNWIVDRIPVSSQIREDYARYSQGFPVGFQGDDGKAYVYNHVNIEIQYHRVEAEPDKARIVRFTVEPFSIQHSYVEVDSDSLQDQPYKVANILKPIRSCNPSILTREHTNNEMVSGHGPQLASGMVLFTYDVIWTENRELCWPLRWDEYLKLDSSGRPAMYHWLPIAYSLAAVLVLSSAIAAIMVYNMRSYNLIADDDADDRAEEVGWKAVHANVFRPPLFSPLLLAVCCGAGTQLLCTAFSFLLLLAIGLLSHVVRGSLLTVALCLYAINGFFAGYVSARLYKTFKGDSWQKATVFTALGFPGIAFGFLAVANILAVSRGSPYAVSTMTLALILFLWLGVLVPMVFGGSYIGYRRETIEFPVNTTSIPREIPVQHCLRSLPFHLVMSGILPFYLATSGLYFIWSSVWKGYCFNLFSTLLVLFILVLVTSSEIAVLFNQIQLNGENYNWWWRSFINAGSIAISVLVTAIGYFLIVFLIEQSVQVNSWTSTDRILYFGYMSVTSSLGMFLMAGSTGLFACLWFNKTIFASVVVGCPTEDNEVIPEAPTS